MSAADERRIRVLLAVAFSRGCIMCQAPADGVGLFVPNDSLEWGGRPGAQRYIAYGICERCLASTSIEEREARLERRLGRAA